MITAVLTMGFLLAHRTATRDASTNIYNTTKIQDSEVVKVGNAPEVTFVPTTS